MLYYHRLNNLTALMVYVVVVIILLISCQNNNTSYYVKAWTPTTTNHHHNHRVRSFGLGSSITDCSQQQQQQQQQQQPFVLSSRRRSRKSIIPSSSPATALKLRFIDSSDEVDDETQILLNEISNNPTLDDAIRSSAVQMEDKYGVGWFDKSEAWNDIKTQYTLLSNYDDKILRMVYLKQKPKIVELFTKTPLGPFLAINLLFLITGFSWCDTPFGQIESCPPL